MTEFPSVSTSAARYQQLSINPQKISGQCGRLKCCLNFELDGYTEALKDFPSSKMQLKTKKGSVKCVKLDVFKGVMYYFNSESHSDLIELPIEGVKQIIELNKKGEVPVSFDEFTINEEVDEVSFEDAMEQDNIDRFDKKQDKRTERRENFKKNKGRFKKKKKDKKTNKDV
jgi:cell fate regulator YaaT (PSP1 superfamily)